MAEKGTPAATIGNKATKITFKWPTINELEHTHTHPKRQQNEND